MQSMSMAFRVPGFTTESEDDTPLQQGMKSLDDQRNDADGNPTESPKDGFGNTLLEAGIGRKFVTSLSNAPNAARPNMSSTKHMSSSSRLEIMQMLEEWEEPVIKANSAVSLDVSHYHDCCR